MFIFDGLQFLRPMLCTYGLGYVLCISMTVRLLGMSSSYNY